MSIILYHGPGSVCSQKVRLCLAEKGLDWEDRRPGRSQAAMRAPDYLALNRDGVVPTLIHDGHALVESRLINEYLEDTFPAPALSPADPLARHRMRWWTRQADDDLHRGTFSLMFAISRRAAFIQKPREEWRANLPGMNSPQKQELTMDLAEHGFASRYVFEARDRFRLLLNDMEMALGDSAWLAGDAYSLADLEVTPHLARIRDLGLSRLWEGHPHVTDWLARVTARPSFATAIEGMRSPDDSALMHASAERARSEIDTLIAG